MFIKCTFLIVTRCNTRFTCHLYFSIFFFFCHFRCICKFPGLGPNLRLCSDNPGSLTHRTTRELPPLVLLRGWFPETPGKSFVSYNCLQIFARLRFFMTSETAPAHLNHKRASSDPLMPKNGTESGEANIPVRPHVPSPRILSSTKTYMSSFLKY